MCKRKPRLTMKALRIKLRLSLLILTSCYLVAGLIRVGEWQNGNRLGYRLYNIATEEIHPFAKSHAFPEAIKRGRYSVYPSALAFGLQALSDTAYADRLIVDEVGL